MQEIENEIINNNSRKLTEEEKILELKLKFNSELYEQKVISSEVFKEYRQKIIKQMNRLKNQKKV
ncbi:MAG: hypothetical protein Q4G04_01490 [bacterium]|nr:hypothetical protein [bacterium]